MLNDLKWNSAMLDFPQLALPIFWTIFPVLDLVSVGLGADVTVFGLSCVRRVIFENFNGDRMGEDS